MLARLQGNRCSRQNVTCTIPNDDKYMKISTRDCSIGTKINIGIDVILDTVPGRDSSTCLSRAATQLLSTSVAHLVVECEQVVGHRIQSGLVPAIQKSRLILLGRALDPGVENVYTWLRGGVLNGEADWTSIGWTDCGA
ncbi:hypothetical protein BASA83_011253 [Batrachochytrium salamandrivorans]|nr:hypothetical protein BASA83_011253 [Batrachochytrium salamandrivorans]